MRADLSLLGSKLNAETHLLALLIVRLSAQTFITLRYVLAQKKKKSKAIPHTSACPNCLFQPLNSFSFSSAFVFQSHLKYQFPKDENHQFPWCCQQHSQEPNEWNESGSGLIWLCKALISWQSRNNKRNKTITLICLHIALSLALI